VLGGAGSYASLAASYFVEPKLISIVGRDLKESELDKLKKHQIDLSNVQYGERSFHWAGSYEFDMNEAKTRKTEINCLKDFQPNISKEKCDALLLANCDPEVQLKAIEQLSGKPFVALDTMNYWIENKRSTLVKVIEKSDLVVVNESEARLLFKTSNLIKAGRELLALGTKYAIIKKGEHGALLFSDHSYFSAPGYPLEDLKDPTGAGDSFVGGLVGYMLKTNGFSEANMRKGVIYGSVIASFCAEEFGTGYAEKIKVKDIEERYDAIKKICHF
jgi:sugar/nucleoside kinase (ribokinase family)